MSDQVLDATKTAAAAGARRAAVRLDGVSKHFGETVAVNEISLDVADGEFFTMLGPSGSGKTTTLRIIAGFERPSAGAVFLHGVEVSRLAPYERDVNTVFQDYALFPHMSVRENVEYGLMVRHVPKAARGGRVDDALAMVQLEGLGGRRINQLSGGQRQRVALARALVNRPSVLLLDEPLGALDLKLRQAMQVELKAIQQHVGITFVYVTHDQEEALTMSDRLAVFNHGRIEQVGTPAQIYETPASAFVAGFVGVSNVLGGDVAERLFDATELVTVRPEKIVLAERGTAAGPGEVALNGTIRDALYLGSHTRYVVAVDAGADIVVIEQNSDDGEPVGRGRGAAVTLLVKRASIRPLRSPADGSELKGAGP